MRPALACLFLANACGGDPSSVPMDGVAPAIDATFNVDAAPIPDDAIYLSPSRGTATGSGSALDPWPGLEAAIAAGLLATVADGATLVLEDGDHGNASFSGTHDVAVTVRNAPDAQPRLGRLHMPSGRGWHFRGLTISPAYASAVYAGAIVALGDNDVSSDLILEDSAVFAVEDTSAWTVADWLAAPSGINLGRDGTGLVVRRTHVYNVRFGITMASFDAVVAGNLINDFSADGIRVTRDGGQVIDNVIKNVHVSEADGDANHDDAIQCFLFNVGTGTVRDIVVRGNIAVNYEGTPTLPASIQGIGFFDGPLVNHIVEDNVMVVDSYHGVALFDAQGSRVVNNVTFTRWSNGNVRPWVMLGEKLDMAAGNVAHDNLAHSFNFTADATVDQANNQVVDLAVAEQRLTDRLAAIEATWGPLVDGAPRLSP